jgi:hypothetical protein
VLENDEGDDGDDAKKNVRFGRCAPLLGRSSRPLDVAQDGSLSDQL